MVGYRETNLVNWGCFDDPDYVDYSYANMTDWGRKRYITPGIAIGGELITTDLVEINLAIRILLGSSYFDGWENEPTFVTKDPLGNPVDKNHPWNKVTLPKPQKRDFTDKYTWVVSPRIYDKRTDTHVCCDTGGGPFARQWCTAKAGLVDFGYVEGHRAQHQDGRCRARRACPEMEMEWHVPEKSNAIERDRARTYHQAYSALIALHNLERAMKEVQAGRTKSWNDFKVPDEAVSCGFHEAARGVLSHHMVIKDGKIANYQPYPPTPWNASPRDVYGTPGPYEDAVQNTPIFEENGPENFKGIDIMRAVRSFDPCLPCGVHMYGGNGHGAEGGPHTHGAGLDGRGRPRRSSIARVQELTGHLEDLADPACRAIAEELTSAVVQMYGAGLERIVELAGEDAAARRRRRRAGVGLLMIHDLYPVPIEERVGAGARPRAALHGVPRRQRRAARDRGRRREAASRGQLQVVPGVVVDARARRAPGARGAVPRPRRDGCRGPGGRTRGRRVPRRGAADGRPAPTGRRGTCSKEPRELAARGPDDGERGGATLLVANVEGTLLAYRDGCAGCGSPLSAADARRARHSCARRAREASSCRGRVAAWTTTSCSSSRSRCCARGHA